MSPHLPLLSLWGVCQLEEYQLCSFDAKPLNVCSETALRLIHGSLCNVNKYISYIILFSLHTLLLVHLPGTAWELYIQIEIGHTDWIYIYIRHSKQIEQNKPWSDSLGLSTYPNWSPCILYSHPNVPPLPFHAVLFFFFATASEGRVRS